MTKLKLHPWGFSFWFKPPACGHKPSDFTGNLWCLHVVCRETFLRVLKTSNLQLNYLTAHKLYLEIEVHA